MNLVWVFLVVEGLVRLVFCKFLLFFQVKKVHNFNAKSKTDLLYFRQNWCDIFYIRVYIHIHMMMVAV